MSALLLVELVHLFRQFGNRVLDLDDLEALIEGMIYNVSRLDKLGLVHSNAVVDRLEQQELASIQVLQRSLVAEARDVVVRVEEVGVELLREQRSRQYEPIASEQFSQ